MIRSRKTDVPLPTSTSVFAQCTMNDAVLLLTDEELDDDILEKRYDLGYSRHPLDVSRRFGNGTWSRVCYIGGLLVIWLSTAVVSSGVWNYWLHSGHKSDMNRDQLIFSPAQSEVEYLVQTFQQNISEVPVSFRDPDTADMAWDDLYNSKWRGRSLNNPLLAIDH